MFSLCAPTEAAHQKWTTALKAMKKKFGHKHKKKQRSKTAAAAVSDVTADTGEAVNDVAADPMASPTEDYYNEAFESEKVAMAPKTGSSRLSRFGSHVRNCRLTFW